jgi:hypothetical protein
MSDSTGGWKRGAGVSEGTDHRGRLVSIGEKWSLVEKAECKDLRQSEWTVEMEHLFSELTTEKPSPVEFSEEDDQKQGTQVERHFSDPPPMGFPEWSDLKSDDRPA